MQQRSVGGIPTHRDKPPSRLQRDVLTNVKKKNSYGESAAFSQKQQNRYKNGRIGVFCADSR